MSRTSVRTLLLPALTAGALLSGCEEELQPLAEVECVAATDVAASDDDFSSFELAYTLGGATGFDGMVIDSPRPSSIGSGERWTIGGVEVLVVRPVQPLKDYLAQESDLIELQVDIWEGDDPNASRAGHWKLKREVRAADLEWSSYSDPTVLHMGPLERCSDDECSDVAETNTCKEITTTEGDSLQYCEHSGHIETAWMKFDFATEELLGKEDLTSDQFTIGVRWTAMDWPLVAASDFTKSCYLNWHQTDGEDDEPRRLDPENQNFGCNWPLVRLTGQTIASGENCRRSP